MWAAPQAFVETSRERIMRNLKALALLSLLLALPLRADEQQSYISYDDGGTIVRQTSDGRETEGRVNLPIYAGDEIVTGRRGRTEVVLADGNVLGIDRSSAVGFTSIAASFGTDDQESIIHLRYGKAMFYRARDSRGAARFDTEGATYFSAEEAMFSVETTSAGADRVVVFAGAVEVRTPDRTTVLRRGESAQLDSRGVYSAIRDSVGTADDFERWFAERSERYGARDSRYLDHSLAYAEEDLDRNGSWVNINGYGWGWRPNVALGWRPYYYGHWGYGWNGCLTWVSYEPWGWVPYHYGRWSYDAFYGWFWLPGAAYSPAWVYWWYGPGYVGWAPAGWYDCYRPYYGWAYSPYATASVGFGFYGRVHAGSVDLRPWTFVDSNTMVSNRVDRAAYTTDSIRSRLLRDNDGFATVSSGAARFTREEFRDPAAAINRRLTPGTREGGPSTSGGTPDVTPFFRRDGEVPSAIRDRVVRSRPSDGTTRTVSGTSGGLAPVGRGSVAPIGGGNVAPIGGGSLAPIGGGTEPADRVRRGTDLGTGTGTTSGGTGSVTRGGSSAGNDSGTVSRGSGSTGSGGGTVSRGSGSAGSGSGTVSRGSDAGQNNSDKGTVSRGGSSSGSNESAGRVARPRTSDPVTRSPETPASGNTSEWRGGAVRRGSEEPGSVSRTPESQPPTSDMNSWRGRTVERSGGGESSTKERSATPSTSRGSDVPRRVIDGIGGARVRRSEDSGSSSTSGSTARSSSGSRDSSSKASSSGSRDSSSKSSSSGSRDSSSKSSSGSDSSSKSSSSSSGGSKVDRSSSGSSSSSGSGSSGGSRSSGSSGSSGGGGARVHRGQ